MSNVPSGVPNAPDWWVLNCRAFQTVPSASDWRVLNCRAFESCERSEKARFEARRFVINLLYRKRGFGSVFGSGRAVAVLEAPKCVARPRLAGSPLSSVPNGVPNADWRVFNCRMFRMAFRTPPIGGFSIVERSKPFRRPIVTESGRRSKNYFIWRLRDPDMTNKIVVAPAGNSVAEL